MSILQLITLALVKAKVAIEHGQLEVAGLHLELALNNARLWNVKHDAVKYRAMRAYIITAIEAL
jgi:hypothetical protein